MACRSRGVHRRERWIIVNGVAQIAALVAAVAHLGTAPVEMFFFHRSTAAGVSPRRGRQRR